MSINPISPYSKNMKDDYDIETLRMEMDWLKSEIEEIKPHKHCMNCGIAIPPDKTFCSKKCEDEWNFMLKKKKRMMIVNIVFIFILVFLLMVAGGLR